jgi:hypothetical protein
MIANTISSKPLVLRGLNMDLIQVLIHIICIVCIHSNIYDTHIFVYISRYICITHTNVCMHITESGHGDSAV